MPMNTSAAGIFRVAFVASAAALLLLAISAALTRQSLSVLELRDERETCVPCSVGNNCHSGCLTKEAVKQFKAQHLVKAAQHRSLSSDKANARKHQSDTVNAATARMQKQNSDLLHLTPADKKGLGGILNSVERNLLRAEAAEVEMRRQARLHQGTKETIMDVYKHLSPSDQRAFRLRARKFELDLHKAERSIVTSEDAVMPIANARISAQPSHVAPRLSRPHLVSKRFSPHAKAAIAGAHVEQPSWTSAMSRVIGSLVKDGSGSAWGYSARPTAKGAKAKASTQKLPGVLMDNWTLDKGALGAKPTGDFSKLPGVKAFGW